MPEYDTYMDYQSAIVRENTVALPFTYTNEMWALLPKGDSSSSGEFRVNGVMLSRSGKELLPIVDVEPDEKYTEALKASFEAKGMVMERVG